VTVYALPPSNPYQKPFRLVTWGAILVLLGIFVFSLHEPAGLSDPVGHAIGWFAGAITLVAVLAAAVLGAKEGLWKSLRKFRFEVSDGKIIQTREASPPVEIPLDQIEYVRESGNWLLVGGGSPSRQIVIPRRVKNFDLLRRDLAARCLPTPLKLKLRPVSFLPLVVMVAAYVFLFTSHARVVVISAGVAALALQGIGTYSFVRTSRDKTVPTVLVLTFALSVILVAWLVYRQMTPA
jgi:hypothetical protein